MFPKPRVQKPLDPGNILANPCCASPLSTRIHPYVPSLFRHHRRRCYIFETFADASKLPRNDLLFDLQMSRRKSGGRRGTTHLPIGRGGGGRMYLTGVMCICHPRPSSRHSSPGSFLQLSSVRHAPRRADELSVKFVALCHRFPFGSIRLFVNRNRSRNLAR